MDDTPKQVFPHEDALCEQCGYPIKGIRFDAYCPECGLAVVDSSPANRTITFEGHWLSFAQYVRMAGLLLFRPKQTFRSLSINGTGLIPEQFLFRTSFLAGLIMSATVYIGSAYIITPRFHQIPLLSAIWLFVLTAIGITVLTFVEMVGVTAFSQRRGWRVPFPLAQRVCCLASVGWLPAAFIAGLGIWMIQAYGVGRPWFDHLFGLVRAGWLVYAGLFMICLFWFETLVWLAVRQVRFANNWPQEPRKEATEAHDAVSASNTCPPADTPLT